MPPTQTADQQAAPLIRAASTWKPGSDIGVLPATLQHSARVAGPANHISCKAFDGNMLGCNMQAAGMSLCNSIGSAQ